MSCKYTVDVFTPASIGTKCPENSYDVDTIEECTKIIKDCSRPIAGIAVIEVWIHQENLR